MQSLKSLTHNEYPESAAGGNKRNIVQELGISVASREVKEPAAHHHSGNEKCASHELKKNFRRIKQQWKKYRN